MFNFETNVRKLGDLTSLISAQKGHIVIQSEQWMMSHRPMCHCEYKKNIFYWSYIMSISIPDRASQNETNEYCTLNL